MNQIMYFQTAYKMRRGVRVCACVCVHVCVRVCVHVCVCVCVLGGERDHERSCMFLAVQSVTYTRHSSYSIGQS